jgi:hypothetical protein
MLRLLLRLSCPKRTVAGWQSTVRLGPESYSADFPNSPFLFFLEDCCNDAYRISATFLAAFFCRVILLSVLIRDSPSSPANFLFPLYGRSLRAFSRLGIIRTTGPFQNAGLGRSANREPGAYRIASSQWMPFCLQQSGCGCAEFCFAISINVPDTRCSGSQNCRTRGSDIRANVLPLGGRQSVARIGSQTTITRTLLSPCRVNNC